MTARPTGQGGESLVKTTLMADVVSIELYKEADFEIAGLLVRPSLTRVEAGGKVVRLEPKIMKVLLVLWRAGGSVVSRDDLINEVWEGQIVTDDAVTRTISRLRKLFKKDFPCGVEIETVQKSGYRLKFKGEQTEAGKKRPGTLVILAGLVLILAVAGYFVYPRNQGPSLENLFSGPVEPLTTFPGKERYPAFDATGNYLLFAWAREDQGPYDIFRMDTQSRDLLQLTNGPGSSLRPTWSPDGTRAAFFRINQGVCSIHIMPSIGGNIRKIANCSGEPRVLDWSPDGATLLAGWRPGPYQKGSLVSIDLETLEMREILIEGEFALGVDDAYYSPDGETIAAALSTTLGVEDLYILPVAGGTPERITHENLKIHDLRFVPGGSGVLASTNWLGAFGAWVIPLDGGPPVNAGNLPNGIDGIVASPKGQVVLEVWDETAGMWRLDLEDKTLAPLPQNSTRFDWDGQPSPDGGKLAFVSDRSGAAEAWVADLETNAYRQLTNFKGPWTHSPRWAPDGKTLVFASPAEGRFDLFLADPETGEVKQLTHSQGNNFAPAWSPDGRFVYFGSDRSGQWQIWRLEVETGLQEVVTSEGARTAKISPDGTFLYFTKIDEPGLWRQPLWGNGAPVKILGDPVPVDWNTWAVTENSIYFIRRRIPEKPELMRFDLATETGEIILEIPALLHNSGLWVSGDESEALITLIERAEADLVLAGARD